MGFGVWGLGKRVRQKNTLHSCLWLISREGLEKFGDHRGTATMILSFIPPKPEARVDIQRVVLATAKTKSIIVVITITAPRHRESHSTSDLLGISTLYTVNYNLRKQFYTATHTKLASRGHWELQLRASREGLRNHPASSFLRQQ